MDEQVLRTQVRLPVDLAEWLKKQARKQSRSMNGQLVELLKQVRGMQADA